MSHATDMLAAYQAAELDVLAGKEGRVGDRSYRFEDLAEIRKGRQEWEARVRSEQATASRSPTIGGLGFSVARMDR